MRRPLLLPLLLVLAHLAPGLPGRAGAQDAPRPNIVLVLVDDLGWQDTEVSHVAERDRVQAAFRTPHVSRLAREGTTFTNAYAASPVCTPTRVSIHLGVAPVRHRVTYWTLHAGKDTTAAHPSLAPPGWKVDGLQPGSGSLASVLQQTGYRTIHVGKAHLGAVGTPGADPRQLGFDHNVAGHGAGAPGSYLGVHDFRTKGRQGQDGASVWDVPGLEAYHGKEVFLTDVLAAEACREVRAAVVDGEPFFLNFCPYAVHTPLQADPARVQRYADLDPREAAYATLVEAVDDAIGAILATLEELEVLDETIVVVTSDNGGLSAHARGGPAHRHNAPLRSGKGSAYEGGVRVPWIVRYPGMPAGATCDVPVIAHDLYPTLLTAAGARMPERVLDGRDLHPLLLQKKTDLVRRDLVWHMPHAWGAKGPGIEPFSSIRSGRWKLIFFHADRRFELYDLEADLGETSDLASRDPERVRGLATRLRTRIEGALGQMSIDRATGRAVVIPTAD